MSCPGQSTKEMCRTSDHRVPCSSVKESAWPDPRLVYPPGELESDVDDDL